MHKEISVIIPHYNSIITLLNLLDTIPKMECIEILVIDDKSDITCAQKEKIIDALENRGLFLDNQSEKKGAGVCRNIGLDHAHGKWVVFADADDYFLPASFKTFLDYKNDPHDIIFCNMTSIAIDTGEVSERHKGYSRLIKEFIEYHDELSEANLRYNWSSPTTKMIRRALIEKSRIRFEDTAVANDVMFSLKTGYAAKTITAVNETVYCVTKSGNSLTSASDNDRKRKRFEVYWGKYAYLREKMDPHTFEKMGMGIFEFLLYAARSRGLALGMSVLSDTHQSIHAKFNIRGWICKHIGLR